MQHLPRNVNQAAEMLERWVGSRARGVPFPKPLLPAEYADAVADLRLTPPDNSFAPHKRS